MSEPQHPITLVGEEIASPWNSRALADVAEAFGGSYQAFDSADGETTDELHASYDWLLAAENGIGARSIYSFRPPANGRGALLLGNEAKGLRRRTLKLVDAVVEIPLPSQNINCLNVAAAAAVLLYYLALPEPLAHPVRTLARIQRDRPDLLLIGGPDPLELGSAIRSTCAFGWDRLLLQDRFDAWYECDRRIRSEGRGAARRGRNPIRVIPCPRDAASAYRRIVVVTTHEGERPLHRTQLTGPGTLLVIGDEGDLSGLGSVTARSGIVHASLPLSGRGVCRLHQHGSIVLAEAARQLGRLDGPGIFLPGPKQRYRREIEAAPAGAYPDFEVLPLQQSPGLSLHPEVRRTYEPFSPPSCPKTSAQPTVQLQVPADHLPASGRSRPDGSEIRCYLRPRSIA